MLIFLKISPSDFKRMKSNERFDFFEKFTKASREGNHVFVISHDLAKWIERKESLNDEVKSQMAHLYQTNGYLSFDDIIRDHDYLEIKYGNNEPMKKSEHKWTIGHKKIIEGNYLEKCMLLVENEKNDGVIYELILNNEKSKYVVGTARLTYQIIGGEGKNIANKFDKLVGEQMIFCCICDSDKLAPSDKSGATYANVKKIEENKRKSTYSGKRFLGYLDCTPCHESENMLSLETVRSLLKAELDVLMRNEASNRGGIENLKTAIRNLYDLEKLLNKQKNSLIRFEMWLNFDTKEGLNSDNSKFSSVDENVKEWIRNCYSFADFNEINIQKIHKDIMKMLTKHDSIKSIFHRQMREHPHWDEIFSKWIKKFIWYLYGQEPNDYLSNEDN